jgi:hypothetical protein
MYQNAITDLYMKLFGLAKCMFTFTSKKIINLSATEKILLEEAVKFDDSIELRNKQKNALLSLIEKSEISVIAHISELFF